MIYTELKEFLGGPITLFNFYGFLGFILVRLRNCITLFDLFLFQKIIYVTYVHLRIIQAREISM